MKTDRQNLSIREVSRRVRIAKHTLRFWEKELGGILRPQRTQGGQRHYRPEDIFVLEQIRHFRQQGLSLSEIREKFSMPIL